MLLFYISRLTGFDFPAVNFVACYSPLLAEWTGAYNSNGKKIIRFRGGYFHESDKDDPKKFQVPCGKCIGCRLDYAKRWSDRMYLEFDHTKKAVFITLTYRDEDLPDPVGFDHRDRRAGRGDDRRRVVLR